MAPSGLMVTMRLGQNGTGAVLLELPALAVTSATVNVDTGARTVSTRSPLGENRTQIVGRLLRSREKTTFRVTMRPALSTISARENVALELPLAPEGVVSC